MMTTITHNQKVPTKRLFWWSSFSAAVMLLAALATPLLVGHTFVADDLGEFHLPARAFYAQCLADGHRFDWWPALYSGVYLTGEGQAGTYHPVHLALYRLLPLPLAFGLEVWLCYPFMLGGMYLWLRRKLRRRDAALFGSLLFTFCGFNLLHLVHVNAIAVVAHIPWLLWMLDIALSDRHSRKVAWARLGIAVMTGSQILLGYPQYVWFSLLALALYAVITPRKNPLLPVGAAVLTGLVIGSIQLLPTAEALQNSVRQTADSSFAAWGSLHPLNFLQLLAPYLFEHRVVGQNTHELGLYLGAIPLTLVGWLLLRRNRSLRNRHLIRYALLLGLVATQLALGSFGVLYVLQTWLPVVGKFRFPCRAIVLLHLAMALFAAMAAVALIRDRRQDTDNQIDATNRLWCLPIASLLVSIAGLCLWPDNVASWWLALTGPALFAVAVGLVLRAERGSRWAMIGLALFAAADLGAYGLSYSVISRTESLQSFADSAQRPPGDGGRVAVDLRGRGQDTLQIGNRMVLSGFDRIGGYVGLEPQRQLDYREPNALRAAGAEWIASTANTQLNPQGETGQLTFQKVPAPLPTARLLSHARFAAQPQDVLAQIDIARTALVDRPLELPPSEPGRVTEISLAPGAMHYQTSATDRQLLVVAQNFHGGWQVAVDGQPASVWRVYGDLIGCVVPGGDHQVCFDFRPGSRETGLTLSLCGLSLMLCGLLASLQRVRK